MSKTSNGSIDAMNSTSRKVSRPEQVAITIIFAYFAIRLIWFALAIKVNVPPDEITHLGIIDLYKNSFGSIENTPESLQYGLVTHAPYLYYLVMGMLLKLNFFGILEDYIFVRIVNVVISLLTIVVSYNLAVKLTSCWSARVLFLVLLTNTLMFTFLSSSASYDNLLIFFTALSFYYFIAYIQERAPINLFLLITFVCAGSLVKITFLPLIIPFALIIVWDRRSSFRHDLAEIVSWLSVVSFKRVILIVITLISLSLSFILYGGNLIHYGKIVPSCSDVLSVDECM